MIINKILYTRTPQIRTTMVKYPFRISSFSGFQVPMPLIQVLPEINRARHNLYVLTQHLSCPISIISTTYLPLNFSNYLIKLILLRNNKSAALCLQNKTYDAIVFESVV